MKKYIFEYEVMNLETTEILAQCEFEEKLSKREEKAFDNFFTAKEGLSEEEYREALNLRERILDIAIEMESQNPEWDSVRDKIMITICSVSSEDPEADQDMLDEAEENLSLLLKRVGQMNYDRTGTLTDRAFERNRRCHALNMFLDVLDAIDHITERNTEWNKVYYKRPLRYEVLSVIMAMGHAYGNVTVDDVKKFCEDNKREKCVLYDQIGMDEETLLELSDHMKKRFDMLCQSMGERLARKKNELCNLRYERVTVEGKLP